MKDAKNEMVKGLRAMADFLEAQAQDSDIGYNGITYNIFARSNEQLADMARRFAPVAKRYADSWFCLTRKFSDNVQMEVNRERKEVCQRIVTGTEIVKVPIYDTPKQIGEREEVREIVEWDCGQSILAPKAEEAAPLKYTQAGGRVYNP